MELGVYYNDSVNLFLNSLRFVKNELMNSTIIFNQDQKSASIYLMKIFNTDVSPVWNHFSEASLLDQWWMPEPLMCETLNMNFIEDGSWNYAIVSPENKRQFAGVRYHEVNFHRSFDWTDFFTDEAGNIDQNLPSSNWLIGFTGIDAGTKLTVNIHFPNAEEMEKTMKMDFENRVRTSLNQLEDLLNKKD